jgi:hypothetical protein
MNIRRAKENDHRHTEHTSRSFFKRNAVGMGLSAITADYW